MNVFIQKDALLPLEKNFPFREHTISALVQLIDAQFSLSISEDSLSDIQKNILLQEKISYTSDPISADFNIQSVNENLILTDDKKVELFTKY